MKIQTYKNSANKSGFGMRREVKGLYGQCFQFAFDVAKKAERALQHELGNPDLSFLQFGYLAGKEGLLAGEKLYLDLKSSSISIAQDIISVALKMLPSVFPASLDPTPASTVR
jgi:hypothetical protein